MGKGHFPGGSTTAWIGPNGTAWSTHDPVGPDTEITKISPLPPPATKEKKPKQPPPKSKTASAKPKQEGQPAAAKPKTKKAVSGDALSRIFREARENGVAIMPRSLVLAMRKNRKGKQMGKK